MTAATAAGTPFARGGIDAAGTGHRTACTARMGRRGAHLAIQFFRTATGTDRRSVPANQQLAIILTLLTIIFVEGHFEYGKAKATAASPARSRDW